MRKIVGWLLVLPFLGALFVAWLNFHRMNEGNGVHPDEGLLRIILVSALVVAAVFLRIILTLLRGEEQEPRDLWAGAGHVDGQRKPISKRGHVEWRLHHFEDAIHFKTPDISQNRSTFRILSQSGVVMTKQPKRIGQTNFAKTRNSWVQSLANNNALPNYSNDLLRRQAKLGLSVGVTRRGGSSQRTTNATFNVAKVRSVKNGGGYSVTSQPNHLVGSGRGAGLGNLTTTLTPTSLTPDCIEAARYLDTHSPIGSKSWQWRLKSLVYFDVCTD